MNARKDVKKIRTRYTAEFKQQALERADRDGVATAARDLGLQGSQLYSWRHKARKKGQTTEEQKLQQAELARLKRENSRLLEEVEFLKRRQRTSPRNRGEVRHDCRT